MQDIASAHHRQVLNKWCSYCISYGNNFTRSVVQVVILNTVLKCFFCCKMLDDSKL